MNDVTSLVFAGVLVVVVATMAFNIFRRRAVAAGEVGDAEVAVSKPTPTSELFQVDAARRTWHDLTVAGGLATMFCYMAFQTVAGAARQTGEMNSGAIVNNIIFQAILAFVAAFMISRTQPISAVFGKRWKQWPLAFILAPSAVGLMWLMIRLIEHSGVMQWLETQGIETTQQAVNTLRFSADGNLKALMIFAAVISAPLCEEIIFRGYMYPAFKKYAGGGAACLATSAVFAMAHSQLSVFLPLLIFGAVLTALYEFSGSLWLPVATHFCFNYATVLHSQL